MTQNTTRFALLAALLVGLAGCASDPGPEPPPAEPPGPRWQDRAADLASGVGGAVKTGASAVKTGASAVGNGLGTAYQGVSKGFREPEADATYGPPPRDYVRAIRRHFLRVEGLPASTRFEFGEPQRGYMNRGLLRGGGVAWQGYLVDVEVEVQRELTRLKTKRRFVVRMRDDEVVDVHGDGESSILNRL